MKNKQKSFLTIVAICVFSSFYYHAQSQQKDCGPMPEGLREISKEQAEQLWNNYTRSQKEPCISGTWTDHPVLTYLACLSNPGLYSGIAKNDKDCLFVVWAVEQRQGEDRTYRYFALQSDLDCSDSGRTNGNLCPTRCP